MKPLIKWTGGKFRELKYFSEFLPSKIDKYIEPFFGSGAVYFFLEPKRALINDKSKDLMIFYSLIKDKNEMFKKYIYLLSSFWDNLNYQFLEAQIFPIFRNYINFNQLTLDINLIERSIITPLGDNQELAIFIGKSLQSKLTNNIKSCLNHE